MEEKSRKLYHDPNLQIIFAITLVAVMGVASITPVFPMIRDVFGISAKEVGYLVVAFTLPGVLLTPVLGAMADRFGRKVILVPSLILFSIAGLLCGFMRDFEWLLGFRFLQGIGAASIGSLNVTLIGDLYDGRKRTAAMGYNASVLSIGTASYPAIGGVLAMLAWYYPFFLPLLALPVGLLVLKTLDNPEPKVEENFWDYFRTTLGYLNNKRVLGLLLISIFTFILLYGPFLTYFPILLGDRFDAKAYEIGIILSFASVSTAITSSQLDRISQRIKDAKLLLTAFFLYMLAMLTAAFVPGTWYLLISAALFGIAQGVNLPALLNMLASSAPLKVRGAFMSVNGWVLRIGQTLGPVLAGFVYAEYSLNATFYFGMGIAVIMMLIASTMILKKK